MANGYFRISDDNTLLITTTMNNEPAYLYKLCPPTYARGDFNKPVMLDFHEFVDQTGNKDTSHPIHEFTSYYELYGSGVTHSSYLIQLFTIDDTDELYLSFYPNA